MASVFNCNPSHLKQLELSDNWNLNESDINQLCAGLESPNCRLETLRLNYCWLSEISCGSLALALTANPFHLRELELNFNEMHDAGVKLLREFLESPHCRLQTLRLRCCWLSEISCSFLASALKSNPSHMRDLDLSLNKLQDAGVKVLCEFLGSPHCKLQTLRLRCCRLSAVSCASLANALRSNPSHLKELELTFNKLQYSDMKLLFALVKNPHCRLEILRWR